MIRQRSTLKEYFKTGSLPSATNFEDLIDSMLNQDDDGIRKTSGNPLQVTATGANEGLINFYRLGEEVLTWQIQQNPDGKPGLSIGDAGASRLFIESGTGNVGIGTTSPAAKLDVDGVRIGGSHGRNYFKDEERNKENELGLRVGVAWGKYGIYAENGPVEVGGVEGVSLQNGAVSVATSGNVGIGTTNPKKPLHVISSTPNPILIERAIASDADAKTILAPLPDGTVLFGGLAGTILFFYYKQNGRIWVYQLLDHAPYAIWP